MTRLRLLPNLGPISKEYEAMCLSRARQWEEMIPFFTELETMGPEWSPFRGGAGIPARPQRRKLPAWLRDATPAVRRAYARD